MSLPPTPPLSGFQEAPKPFPILSMKQGRGPLGSPRTFHFFFLGHNLDVPFSSASELDPLKSLRALQAHSPRKEGERGGLDP